MEHYYRNFYRFLSGCFVFQNSRGGPERTRLVPVAPSGEHSEPSAEEEGRLMIDKYNDGLINLAAQNYIDGLLIGSGSRVTNLAFKVISPGTPEFGDMLAFVKGHGNDNPNNRNLTSENVVRFVKCVGDWTERDGHTMHNEGMVVALDGNLHVIGSAD